MAENGACCCGGGRNDKKKNCLVCGKPLIYFEEEKLLECRLCHQRKSANAACEDGHFICDECHAGGGAEILDLLLRSEEKDPVALFLRLCEMPEVHLHGPEHHSIIPCVLLTAYHNCGGELDLARALREAWKRGQKTAGGACGFQGVCGAAAGAGVFASIVSGASPMTPEQWAIPQKLAAQCLEKNAEIGGPRCCKRTGRIAIECAAAFSEKEFGVAMPVSRPRCGFSPWNTECIRERCPYFGDAREARTIRRTRSVCPVCLKNLPAALVREGDGRIFLEKRCAEHGAFRTLVWSGAIDFKKWLRDERPLLPEQGLRCPGDCGLCAEHESGSCCVLLEVTRRCDLRCRFCFARGGEAADEPALDELKAAVDDIVRQCGGVLLQLSGGEPTQRDDLPELVRYAKEAGCSYVQLNTNGLRLAREPDYAARLAAAGLDIVFLQFDGTREDIYETLRGAPLLAQKKKAIEVCGALRLGVTLVPTVVRGVNDDDLGELVKLAVSLAPAVRGIHFQPVSYFGRYPAMPDGAERYTLDRLMRDIADQTGVPIGSFMPSRCDHPLCGFHANYLIGPDGTLRPLSALSHSSPERGSARDNREYVARHWRRAPDEEPPESLGADEMDFDSFLYRVRHQSLTLSAMAFQDAMNLNLERLHRCTLHVYDAGKIKPFCAKYLSPVGETDGN